MSPKSQQPFVYGTFLWPQRPLRKPFYGEDSVREPDIALEILREFSASEFVGKVYIKFNVGSWTVAQFDRVRLIDWYEAFQKTKQYFVFDMQGSGPWEVLYFRTESDESGPYVAVGLRQFQKDKVPSWVATARKRLAL
jgi:hypothetical protein